MLRSLRPPLPTVCCVLSLALLLCLTPAASGREREQPRRGRYACPTELEPLTQTMLRDLPSYLNRLRQRLLSRQAAEPGYAIVAGRPEYEPLPAGSPEYPDPQTANLRQVFFTVLERQYTDRKVTQLQQFHWLFLTQTQAEGWQLALLFSRVGTYPQTGDSVLTPPRDSSQSVTAEAIRLWLRDCQAGSVRPLAGA